MAANTSTLASADYPYGLDDYLSMVGYPDAAVPAFDGAYDGAYDGAAYDGYADLDFDALPTLGSPLSPMSPMSPVSPTASFDAAPYVFSSPASSRVDALDLWSAFGAPAASDAMNVADAAAATKPAAGGMASLFATASPAIDPVQLTGGRTAESPAPAVSHRTNGVRKTSGSSTSSSSKRRPSSLAQQPPKKTAHNLIEKRYRTNLNDKILALRDAVPALRAPARRAGSSSGSSSGDEDELDREYAGGEDDGDAPLAPPHKLNKATILSKATDYILQLEQRNLALARANDALLRQVDGMQIRSMSGGALGEVWC